MGIISNLLCYYREQYENSLFKFYLPQNMEEQTKWTAVCCQKSILTIYMCWIHTLCFILLYLYLFPGMKGGRAQRWKKVTCTWGAVMLVKHNCQGEDFQHFNDFKTVNMWLHRNTNEWHLWWVNSVLRWQCNEAINEVRWPPRSSEADSIHDNTLSPGPSFCSRRTDVTPKLIRNNALCLLVDNKVIFEMKSHQIY